MIYLKMICAQERKCENKDTITVGLQYRNQRFERPKYAICKSTLAIRSDHQGIIRDLIATNSVLYVLGRARKCGSKTISELCIMCRTEISRARRTDTAAPQC